MSLREISTSNIAALNASIVRPILFVRLDFDSGAQRYHTEIGPRTAVHPIHGSESYTGLGDFGGITASIVESIDNAPNPIKLGLSGVNATRVTTMLDNDDYHRREVDLMFGFDDENGDLIDDPVDCWDGYMDKPEIVIGKQRADIQLTCESRASILQGDSDLRFTDEQLQADYAGDLAGEYFFRMLDIILRIGGETVQATTGGVGGGLRRPRLQQR